MQFHIYYVIFLKSKQILEYHPQMLQEYLRGGDQTSFMYPRWDKYIASFRSSDISNHG